MPTENYLEPQRPDLSVKTVSPASPITVTDEQFPWISDRQSEVSTVKIKLADYDDAIRYGSIVGDNRTVEKIARNVPHDSSLAAERSMFKSLPMILRKQRTSSVELVPYVNSPGIVYKTTAAGRNAPRLVFGIMTDEQGKPIVLKLGIAQHDTQQALLGVLKGSTDRRRKQDG